MTRFVPSVLAGLIPALVLLSPSPVPAQDAGDAALERGATRWPGFLGGRDTNVSRAARLPLTWSDDSVAWRITTPGFGQSSPVIFEDTVVPPLAEETQLGEIAPNEGVLGLRYVHARQR